MTSCRPARPSTGVPANGRPTTSAPRSSSPNVTTCTSRSPSSRSTTCSSAPRSRRSTPGSSTTTATATRSGAHSRQGCSPASTATGSPTTHAARSPDTSGWRSRSSIADTIARVERLRPIADRLGCSMAQLALAWCASNPNVSTVITGASRVSQVHDNFAALDVIPLITRRGQSRDRGRGQLSRASQAAAVAAAAFARPDEK